MSLRFPIISTALAACLLLAAGCNLVGPNRSSDAELAHYKQVAKTVEHPQLNTPPSEHAYTPEPRTLARNPAPQQPQEWWDMSLEEAIQTAVARSSVLRDLGGTIVRTPETVRTILNPSQVASDPRFGMEAALSEFDATVASSVIAEKNDRMINNFVASGGTRFFQQDLINFQTQISKTGAAGTKMTLRGTSLYDFNNASFNRFPSVWDTIVEAEIRQPLWQGAGTRFNRLAGPNAVPGFYNGVLIARVNTDISVADFEIGLRDLVSNVENAYWDLYFAYRDLDARIQSRNAALESWKRIKILVESDQAGGQIEREAQSREQYFRYEEEVQNALAGTLQQATTNNNGASGGSFRGVGGVLVSERRLRLAIGLPITDGRMLRPVEDPTLARVSFDWPTASGDAVARRPELLRQRLQIKRREMEFVAARNFLLPRFDVLGRYRFRGLGKDLIGTQNLPFDPADPEGLFQNGSLANLVNGDFQEWQLGGEVSMPVGFRRGWAAVRNAQLNLAREKAVLEEQERQVMHDLSNAVGDMERAYEIMETTYNRRLAAQQNVEILRFRLQSGQPVSPEQVLEAERRLADADIQYQRALVEHMLAIKNIHFEKGTLLEYGHIQLTEQVTDTQGRDYTLPPPAAPPAPPTPPVSTEPMPTPAGGAPLPPASASAAPAAGPPIAANVAPPAIPPAAVSLPPAGSPPAAIPEVAAPQAPLATQPPLTGAPSTGAIEQAFFSREAGARLPAPPEVTVPGQGAVSQPVPAAWIQPPAVSAPPPARPSPAPPSFSPSSPVQPTFTLPAFAPPAPPAHQSPVPAPQFAPQFSPAVVDAPQPAATAHYAPPLPAAVALQPAAQTQPAAQPFAQPAAQPSPQPASYQQPPAAAPLARLPMPDPMMRLPAVDPMRRLPMPEAAAVTDGSSYRLPQP